MAGIRTLDMLSSSFLMVSCKEGSKYTITLQVGLKTIYEETFDNKRQFDKRFKKLRCAIFSDENDSYIIRRTGNAIPDYYKSCPVCGHDFFTRYPQQIYCSEDCRKSAERERRGRR